MIEGLKIERRVKFKQKDSWVYFVCPKDDEKKELAIIEIEFLDKVTCIFWIENCSFRTKNYVNRLGKELFDYTIEEAKKRGHKAVIWEWLDKEKSKKGWEFIERREFKLMKEKDYINSGFDKGRDRHEGMDYIKILENE